MIDCSLEQWYKEEESEDAEKNTNIFREKSLSKLKDVGTSTLREMLPESLCHVHAT